MNRILANFLRFTLLIAIQVLIGNRVHLFGFINPYIYILAILLMPLELPKSIQYLIGFATGFFVDLFAGTYGVHASATLLVALLRPPVISLLNGRRHPQDPTERPIPKVKDFKWLFAYTFLLVLAHHFTITLLETFNMNEFFSTVSASLVNAVFTTFVILALEYTFIREKKH